MVDSKEIAGYYWVLCLNGKPARADLGWQTGNVTVQRRHLGRKHYASYVKICKSKGIAVKYSPPVGWKPPKEYVVQLT